MSLIDTSQFDELGSNFGSPTEELGGLARAGVVMPPVAVRQVRAGPAWQCRCCGAEGWERTGVQGEHADRAAA